MKKIIFLTICIIFFGKNNNINAQDEGNDSGGGNSRSITYIDVLIPETITSGAATLLIEQNKINKGLKKIQKAQEIKNAVLLEIDRVQSKIIKGLSEVSAIVSNSYTLKETYEKSRTIIKDLEKLSGLIIEVPYYSVFGEEYIKIIKDRSIKLIADVASIVKNGDENMMNSIKRTELINNIYYNVCIIEASTSLIISTIEQKKKYGLLKSFNPFKINSYIEEDSRIMKDIINNAKRI